jgi:hypothetical protein
MWSGGTAGYVLNLAGTKNPDSSAKFGSKDLKPETETANVNNGSGHFPAWTNAMSNFYMYHLYYI